MSKLKTKLNGSAAINALTLNANIRSLLRRNMSLMILRAGKTIDPRKRQQMKNDTDDMATGFAFLLSIIVSFMTDEEICDFLDGWKHLITGGTQNDIIHFK